MLQDLIRCLKYRFRKSKRCSQLFFSKMKDNSKRNELRQMLSKKWIFVINKKNVSDLSEYAIKVVLLQINWIEFLFYNIISKNFWAIQNIYWHRNMMQKI
jgi:MoaA/NifB/PqqE/SkfB family radical SAM enzyme